MQKNADQKEFLQNENLRWSGAAFNGSPNEEHSFFMQFIIHISWIMKVFCVWQTDRKKKKRTDLLCFSFFSFLFLSHASDHSGVRSVVQQWNNLHFSIEYFINGLIYHVPFIFNTLFKWQMFHLSIFVVVIFILRWGLFILFIVWFSVTPAFDLEKVHTFCSISLEQINEQTNNVMNTEHWHSCKLDKYQILTIRTFGAYCALKTYSCCPLDLTQCEIGHNLQYVQCTLYILSFYWHIVINYAKPSWILIFCCFVCVWKH